MMAVGFQKMETAVKKRDGWIFLASSCNVEVWSAERTGCWLVLRTGVNFLEQKKSCSHDEELNPCPSSPQPSYYTDSTIRAAVNLQVLKLFFFKSWRLFCCYSADPRRKLFFLISL
jgi:hypothetical protein